MNLAACGKWDRVDMIECTVDCILSKNIEIDNWKDVEICIIHDSLPRRKLRSILNANAERQLFLYSNRAPSNLYILNGDTLSVKQFDQHYFYPIRMKEGVNELVALADTTKAESHITLELCDSVGCHRLMTEAMFGRMFYPLIDPTSKSLLLDMQYYQIMPLTTGLEIFDVGGKRIHELQIADSVRCYTIPELKKGHSYLCKWTLEDSYTIQVVVCGEPDTLYENFRNLEARTSLNQKDSLEVDQLLWRFRFLLKHPSREDDWWWQFKIAPITYQLESIFNKIEGNIVSNPTLNFETYYSPVDGIVQRCIVFTPRDLSRSYPLVVMIRPDESNNHEFFSCPQLARQWALNNAQMLCEKYGIIVMMPEGRFTTAGILSPLMEREILCAIEVMGRRFPIDKNNIFLHANCSGGERALQIASHYPGKFKGIGLYAPFFKENRNRSYPKEKQINLKALKEMPVFIFGDPLDGHSPPVFYKDLLSGMEYIGNPCRVKLKYHSGEAYNVFLIGEEALQFFKELSE